jgi:hypothetical protein
VLEPLRLFSKVIDNTIQMKASAFGSILQAGDIGNDTVSGNK